MEKPEVFSVSVGPDVHQIQLSLAAQLLTQRQGSAVDKGRQRVKPAPTPSYCK